MQDFQSMLSFADTGARLRKPSRSLNFSSKMSGSAPRLRQATARSEADEG